MQSQYIGLPYANKASTSDAKLRIQTNLPWINLLFLIIFIKIVWQRDGKKYIRSYVSLHFMDIERACAMMIARWRNHIGAFYLMDKNCYFESAVLFVSSAFAIKSSLLHLTTSARFSLRRIVEIRKIIIINLILLSISLFFAVWRRFTWLHDRSHGCCNVWSTFRT